MTKAEEIYHRFVNYEWNEIGEGMKVSIIKAIDEALKEGQKLTLNDVSITLPNESEMMHKRYKEYHLAIKNLETIESGSFYSGFRRCWSWLKSYELVED